MDKCIIRKIYCGNGPIPKDAKDKKYSRKGTRYECLKKGFGYADWQNKKKTLSKNSLQQLPYIGPVYEANFKKQKIYTISGLLKRFSNIDGAVEKRSLLNKICKKQNGVIDQKAFNSIILFLNKNGIKKLPSCKIVKE